MATRYLRYADLKERQIVRNRTTLSRWIKHYGFPPGVLLGPNTRAWPEEEVKAWLQARAAARWAAGFAAAVLIFIFPLLAAGLYVSVGCAGGVGRGAYASADEVAPAGCLRRLRSPGDRR